MQHSPLALLVGVVAITSASALSPATIVSQAGAAANFYFQAHPAAAESCGWTSGTLFAGVSHWWKVANNATAEARDLAWSQHYDFVSCGAPDLKQATDPNNQLQGDTYLYLAEAASKPEYAASLGGVLDTQVANTTFNGYWFWVDAVFMAMPTWAHYAQFAATAGNTTYTSDEYLTKAWSIFNDTALTIGLWAPKYGLFFRDVTYLHKLSPNGLPLFWGRGNGWAFASLARTMEQLPDSGVGAAFKSDLTRYFVAMAKSVAFAQGSDGMWRSNVLDPQQYPNPETTGSALFTYSLAWGIRNGMIDAATYQPYVDKAWAALTSIALQPSGLVGWCQPVGASPANNSQNSTSNFCVGQFLLAASELYLHASA